MNKVNKIELDRIKQGCSCEHFVGRTKSFKTKECKACLHKQGISVGRFNHEEITRKQEELKKSIESFGHFIEQFYVENKEVPEFHQNWIQKLLNIKK